MASDSPDTEGRILSVAPSPAEPPAGFVHDVYEHTWTVGRTREQVWTWLCDPATFTDGQIPPWRVEFLTNEAGETGFAEGVYNTHVGPFINFSGVLGEIRDQEYRDLQYFYGSHALSFALFRPTRLQFWVADTDDGSTLLTLRLDTHVRRRFRGLWTRMMRIFWKRFGSWCERAIPNNWLRELHEHQTDDEVVYRHRWEPDMIVVWDNRS
ncbi:MAG: TauD/TfdA family dioxygenase, partial [Actinomycetota bacterium]